MNKSGLGILTGIIFLVIILLGILKNIRSKQNVYSIYVIATVPMLISFSEMAVIVRYLVVISPFIAILFIKGLEQLLSRLRMKTT